MTALNYMKMLKEVSKIATEAGNFIVEKAFKARQPYVYKSGPTDLVTQTDKDIEIIIYDKLQKLYPDHKFIGEERADAGLNDKLSDAPTWLVDPIDGTMNFIHSNPNCCVSIALLVDKIPVVGIINNPILGLNFTASKHGGAFLNDKHKMQVSGETKLCHALLIVDHVTMRQAPLASENFWNIAKRSHGIRSIGSAALNLAMVAMGGCDANWVIGAHHWDVAAGIILVQEAGGVVFDTSGSEFDIFKRRILAASSADLANEISKDFLQYEVEPKDV